MGFIERIRTGSLSGGCVGLVPSCMGPFAARPSTNQAGGDDGSLDTTGGRAATSPDDRPSYDDRSAAHVEACVVASPWRLAREASCWMCAKCVF